jgi:hypothetical protein
MKYKIFRVPFTEIKHPAFAPKQNELFICPDPDMKIAGGNAWLVGMLVGKSCWQLGVFWKKRAATTFAESLTQPILQQIGQDKE